MKRFLIGLLVIALTLVMFVSCESDDDDKDTGLTQPPGEGECMFSLTAFADGRTGSVYVSGWDEAITSVALLIDDEEVVLAGDEEVWGADYDFEPGATYAFDLTVNETYHQTANLVIPHIPNVNFPETWDGQSECEISWTLASNAQSQLWYFYGPDEVENSEDYAPEYISPSQRTYTLSGGFHGFTGEAGQELRLTLEEENWTLRDDILFLAYSSDYASYFVEDEPVDQPPTEDWRYGITTAYYSGREGFIYVYALDMDDIIESCSLTINGEAIAMTYNTEYNEWWGDYAVEEGATYTFNLDINNGAYSQEAELAVPYVAVPTYDETWDGQSVYNLTWELDQDSDAQSLFIFGPDDEATRSIYILSMLRAYLLLAGIHGYDNPDVEGLSVSIDQENYLLAGQLLFITYTYAEAYFGTYGGYDRENDRECARRITHQVIQRI